ncbi:alpha/beta hydrolase [Streptomyces sp. NPDC093225]|uniref:alpha/beta hydrolase n=1 Tax=Streptomyces sp. NPDC093225 TaxID=3366034 RepID=UPI0037FCB3D0
MIRRTTPRPTEPHRPISHGSATTRAGAAPRGSGARRRIAAAVGAAALATLLAAGCGGPGAPVSFDAPSPSAGGPSASPGTGKRQQRVSLSERLTQLPTGPRAEFREESRLADGTTIGVTTYTGPKSGFTGQVWVWAPKQYFDPKYANSGFPVLIALPGSYGYPRNYWIGAGLGLQRSIARWSQEGKGLPFIVVMPVLNPNKKHYYDGSDIPDQPKMGTWMTEDVPDLVRANFRTFKTRDGWAFMGSSSGGFVALKSVLQYPEKFKAVIASGPDIVPDSPLWQGYEDEQEANNPERLAPQLIANGGPDVYLAFQVGSKERGTLQKVQNFIDNFGKGPVKTRLQIIRGGDHNARTYIEGMNEGTMKWISDVLQPPIPAS